MKQFIKKVYRNVVSFSASITKWPLVVQSLVLLKEAGDDSDGSTKLFDNIFKPQEFLRDDPKVTPPLHWKFLPAALGTTTRSAPVSARILKDAKVLGRSGTVISKDNKLVYDASSEICQSPETHSVFNRVIFTKGKRLKGLGLNLSASQSEKNYFHWMTDAIPKLALAQAIGYTISSFDYFVVNSHKQSYQKETLKLLNIPEEKIVALDEHPYLICDALLVTTATCESGNVPGWITKFLRDNFIPSTIGTTAKKIFVGRKNAIWRRLLNEAEVSGYLKQNGFEEVYLEEKTVAEQAAIFSNADIIVAAHGAGLTNVAFCKPATRVIEFFPSSYINQGYWTMSSVLGLTYSYIIGSGIEIENNHDLLRNSDFAIDLNELKDMLHTIH